MVVVLDNDLLLLFVLLVLRCLRLKSKLFAHLWYQSPHTQALLERERKVEAKEEEQRRSDEELNRSAWTPYKWGNQQSRLYARAEAI